MPSCPFFEIKTCRCSVSGIFRPVPLRERATLSSVSASRSPACASSSDARADCAADESSDQLTADSATFVAATLLDTRDYLASLLDMPRIAVADSDVHDAQVRAPTTVVVASAHATARRQSASGLINGPPGEGRLSISSPAIAGPASGISQLAMAFHSLIGSPLPTSNSSAANIRPSGEQSGIVKHRGLYLSGFSGPSLQSRSRLRTRPHPYASM